MRALSCGYMLQQDTGLGKLTELESALGAVIRGKADVQGRHKKQTGGHGQFGDCWIRMEPLPRGGNFEFANEIFGGAIPKEFIAPIEAGIREAIERGDDSDAAADRTLGPALDFRTATQRFRRYR